jgi:hypothetical protein
MGSWEDLIDCQESRGKKILSFQVGEESEGRLFESPMNSAESSYQQGELMEEDQRSILIIGGIEVFLPSSPVEARACVADATTEERQPTETVKEGEKEKILMSAPTEEEHTVEMLTPWEIELIMLEDWLNNPEPEDGCQKTVTKIAREEHSTKLLRNFSQEAEQKMTIALKHAAEDEAEFQSEEQLEEAGTEPTQGKMVEANLSEEEEAEQQFSKGTPELKFAAEWKLSATRGDEDNMRDQVGLSIDKYGEEEVQQKRLHKKSQPQEQLEEVIEEIKKLMLRSAEETVSKEKLNRRDPAIAAGKQQQQQQQSIGASRQFQRKIWDPGGFQHSWSAHEQELMNFSQQWSMMQENLSTSTDASTKQHVNTHLEIRRGTDPLISKIRIIKFCEFMCKVDKMPKPCLWTGVDGFNRITDCKQVQIRVGSGSLFNVMSHRLRCLNEI